VKIMLNGIPGSGYVEVLNEVGKGAKEVSIVRVGPRILEAAKAAKLPVTVEGVLDAEELLLKSLRFTVFQGLLQELADTKRHTIVQTHASFRWGKALRPAFDWHLVRQLDPDVFVVLVDSWQDTWAWMQHDAQWRNQLSLEELLFWREAEVLLTRLMAEELEKDFLLVARSEGSRTLQDLLQHPKATRIYLSHPMTEAKTKDHVESLANNLRNDYLVFDPSSLSDRPFTGAKDPIPTRYGDVSVGADPARQRFLDDIVIGQMARIDYQFIDQTQVTFVYYFPDSPASTGVQSEMIYAKGTNKKVHTLWMRQGNPPPFVRTYSHDRIFLSEKEIIDFLRERYPTKH